MHKSFRNFAFNRLILSFALSVAAGGSAFAQTENTNNSANLVSAASVAGDYEYNSLKKGEGSVSQLSVEDEGAGKLSVAFIADYVYKANGAETFHETEVSGDGKLAGGAAIADITDEAGANCPVKITFAANQAVVQTPKTCSFRVALDGVYKRKSARGDNDSLDADDASKPRAIEYGDLAKIGADVKHYPPGERYVINNVPTAKISRKFDRAEQIRGNFRNLFILRSNFNDGGLILTSSALLKNLRAKSTFPAVVLRLTATLALFESDTDETYNLMIVTKIEGLNKNGETLWTIAGEKPAKVKF